MDSVNPPDDPALVTFAVPMATQPLPELVLAPEIRLMEPPVPAREAPAATTTEPPAAEELLVPATKTTAPP